MEALNPLAPIFAAGIAVQQILEVFSLFIKDNEATESNQDNKASESNKDYKVSGYNK